MGKTLTGMLAAAVILIATGAPRAARAGDAAAAGRVEVSFDYQRQGGSGSNQFAVWVEDAGGRFVKTLLVTDFTAARGGWEYRPNSLPRWVKSANIAKMSQDEVDAVSGATPASGKVTAAWDCRGGDGAPVAAGEYAVLVEATLRGENRVVYRGAVSVGGAAKQIAPEPRFHGSGEAERGMVKNVRIGYIR